MNRLFNPDNPVMQFLSKAFDLILLNLIFILSCIPVITIGCAISSLYYVNLKIYRKEDPYIIQNYAKAFRQNFKQSTLVWLICLVLIFFLGMDFYIINLQDTALFGFVQKALWIICAFLFCMFIYIFPIISHFVCSTKQALKNSVFMLIGHFPYTLLLLLLHGVVIYLCVSSIQTIAFAVIVSGICGFSIVSYLSCMIFDRIFKKYEPEENLPTSEESI